MATPLHNKRAEPLEGLPGNDFKRRCIEKENIGNCKEAMEIRVQHSTNLK